MHKRQGIDLDYVARHFLGRSYPVVMETIRREFGLDLPPAFEDRYRERLLAGSPVAVAEFAPDDADAALAVGRRLLVEGVALLAQEAP